jgi:hypothetical protein
MMVSVSDGMPARTLVACLLLVAAVTSYHFDLKRTKVTSRYTPLLSVSTRPPDSDVTSDLSDSKSFRRIESSSGIIGNNELDRTKRIESVKEIVAKFLSSEAEYFGALNWKIDHITDNNENICFKCVPIGSDAKAVFVKHSQQLNRGGHNKLRYEFEGRELLCV